jgi:hypothetical protein
MTCGTYLKPLETILVCFQKHFKGIQILIFINLAMHALTLANSVSFLFLQMQTDQRALPAYLLKA